MKPSGDRLYEGESDEAQKVERPSCVRFENWSMEFLVLARLRGQTPGAAGKPIVRSLRGTWCTRHESTSGYPKPADLCLGRAKRRETGVEARSRNDVQIFGVTWV